MLSPENCKNTQQLDNETEVLSATFNSETNAFYCRRSLCTGFTPLAIRLKQATALNDDGFKEIGSKAIQKLRQSSSDETQDAFEQVIRDLDFVKLFGFKVKLRVLVGKGYRHSVVTKLHHDSFLNGRVLCAYTGPPPQGAQNEDLIQTSDCTYRLKKNRDTFPLGIGHLWYFATKTKGTTIKPFVHIPDYNDQNYSVPRLLLVGQ